jgi:diguanylate cyclase (GGDEF)-like protein/PAS domain S-box-containing protein
LEYQYQIFNIIALLASGLNLVLALIALRYRKRSPEAYYLGLLMLSASLWTGAVGIQMLQETIGAARVWLAIRMVGVVMVPVFWLLFSLQFSGIYIKSFQKLAIGVIPVAAYLLFLTRGGHNVFVRRIHFSEIQGYMIDLRWVLGPLFWIHFAYGYLLIIAGAVFIFQKALQLRRLYRKQAAALVMGGLIPLAINFTTYLNLFPKLHVNYDPVGFLFAGLALSFALFRLRLFNLLPVAQRMVVNNMRDGMLVFDMYHRIMDHNPAARHILDARGEHLIGKSLSEYYPLAEPLLDFMQSTSSGQIEISVGEGKSQVVYQVELTTLHRERKKIGKLLIMKDITEQQKRERLLWEDASRDHLTGVYNRRYLFEVGNREIQRAIRHGYPLSLILFDIDNFKQVNDSSGHLAGDKLLIKIANICQETTRQEDILARYGGDEFVILSLDADQEGALELAERIRKKVTQSTTLYQGEELGVTASLGVTSLADDAPKSVPDLIKQADDALYQAKRGGRNQVCLWKNAAAKHS